MTEVAIANAQPKRNSPSVLRLENEKLKRQVELLNQLYRDSEWELQVSVHSHTRGWWELQLRAVLAKTVAKHVPKQLVGLYKLVWGPAQGPSEIELAELVAGKLKLRDLAPPSRHVCYYTDMEDMVVLSLSVHELVDLTGRGEEEGEGSVGGGMAVHSKGGGLCTSPSSAHGEAAEPPTQRPRRPAIVEVQCYQDQKGVSKAREGEEGTGQGRGGEEEKKEGAKAVDPDELRRKDLLIAILQQKLQELSKNQEESEMTLAEAQARLQAAAARLMQGDERAQAEFDHWDKFINNHPEHLQQVESERLAWLSAHVSANTEALRLMRTFVPPDIFSTTQQALLDAGLSPPLAKRLWKTKALWLLRADPTFIAKIHESDFNSKYSHQGLDLMELRALFACLPERFENDQNGKKAEWRSNLLTKLKQLTKNVDALPRPQKRCPLYDKVGERGPFSSEGRMHQAAATKSSAFDNLARDEVEALRHRKEGGGGAPAVYESCRRDAKAAETPEKPKAPAHICRPPASVAPRARASASTPSASPSSMPKPAFLAELSNRTGTRKGGHPGKEEACEGSGDRPRTPLMQDLFAQIKKRQCE